MFLEDLTYVPCAFIPELHDLHKNTTHSYLLVLFEHNVALELLSDENSILAMHLYFTVELEMCKCAVVPRLQLLMNIRRVQHRVLCDLRDDLGHRGDAVSPVQRVWMCPADECSLLFVCTLRVCFDFDIFRRLDRKNKTLCVTRYGQLGMGVIQGYTGWYALYLVDD